MRTNRGPAARRPRIIFLAGAPKAADLAWDEATLRARCSDEPPHEQVQACATARPEQQQAAHLTHTQTRPANGIAKPSDGRPDISTAGSQPDSVAPIATHQPPRWRLVPLPSLLLPSPSPVPTIPDSRPPPYPGAQAAGTSSVTSPSDAPFGRLRIDYEISLASGTPALWRHDDVVARATAGPYVGASPPSFLPLDLPVDTAAARTELATDLLNHSFSVESAIMASSFADDDAAAAGGGGYCPYRGGVGSSIADASWMDSTSFMGLSPATISRQIPTTTDGYQDGTSINPPEVPKNLPITNIKALPVAAHLNHLAPHTITVNLICGILSIPPLRTVTIRPRQAANAHPNTSLQPRTMDIQELLVGDDTAAGFSITFWLQPTPTANNNHHQVEGDTQTTTSSSPNMHHSVPPATTRTLASPPLPPDHSLRTQLASLHTGDTLLLTNIALSAFRGKIQGQSISPRLHPITYTKIVLLRPAPATAPAVSEWGKCFSAMSWEKLVRVHEWVGRFICPQAKRVREETEKREESRGVKRCLGSSWGKGKGGAAEEELPPDTPA